MASGLALAISASVHGNPTGPQVAHGSAVFSRPDAATLNVANSPSAIINWQGFSIGANEVTRFLQQSASSAVLNRVLGSDVSHILGRLSSNGRVFLVNGNGIVFGPHSVVDTAGFIASTLDITDEDFLAGRLNFSGGPDSGFIRNQGHIRTSDGGEVVLIAPSIENEGVIETPDGDIVLAAGREVRITSLDAAGIHFEVQAPGDKVVNLGRLIAEGGAVGLFADTLTNTGVVEAGGVTRDADGNIVLSARGDIDAAGTLNASGPDGGKITLQSETGTTMVSGRVDATGSAGTGGEVDVLGERVALLDGAEIDASGTDGGGGVRIGGDVRGGGDTATASGVWVGSGASVRADATVAGDGGQVVVFADEAARVHGELSARGGPEGGDGGFVETSGRTYLEVGDTPPDTSAPAGDGGEWLIDPYDVTIGQFEPSGGSLDGLTPNFAANGNNSTIDVDVINAALDLGQFVIVDTGASGTQNGDIFVNADIVNSGDFSPQLTLDAAGSIFVNADIRDVSPNGSLTLELLAGADIQLTGNIVNGGGDASGTFPTLTAGGNITVDGVFDMSGGGGISPSLNAGGNINLNSAFAVTQPDQFFSTTLSAGNRIDVAPGADVNLGTLTLAAGNLTVPTTATLRTPFGATVGVQDNPAASVNVDGGTWLADETTRIGATGTATLTVANGGVFDTIDDGFARLFVGGEFNCGLCGSGTLNVQTGGVVDVGSFDGGPFAGIDVGTGAGSVGNVTVDGAGSQIILRGTDNTLRLGRGGTGNMTVSGGASVSVLQLDIGRGDGSGGAGGVIITDAGSTVRASNDNGHFSAGYANEAGFVRVARQNGAFGRLDVLNGGLLEVAATTTEAGAGISIARDAGSTGVVVVDGATIDIASGTDTTNFGPFISVGQRGQGQMTVTNTSTVTLTGPEAFISVSHGDSGLQSSLTIDGASQVIATGDDATMQIAGWDDGDGLVTVSGTGSLLRIDGGSTAGLGGGLIVGEYGQGRLEVTAGAGVEVVTGTSHGLVAGYREGASGTVIVDGPGSTLTTSGTDHAVIAGHGGTGNIIIRNQGLIDTLWVEMGWQDTGNGTITVTDAGSELQLSNDNGLFSTPFANGAGFLRVGREAGSVARLNVLSGGLVEIRDTAGAGTSGAEFSLARAKGSDGAVLIDGAGSRVVLSQVNVPGDNPELFAGPTLTVSRRGTADLTVQNGGEMLVTGPVARLIVGRGAPASDADGSRVTETGTVNILAGGNLTVTGDGARAGIGERGADATGVVNVTGAGAVFNVDVTGNVSATSGLAVGDAGTGTLTVGSGGSVNVTSVGGNNVRIGTDAGAQGQLNVQAGGTLDATGTGSEIAVGGFGEGEVHVVAGGNVSAATVSVADRLSGSGTVTGDVVVTGGEIAPGASPGTLTIAGDLTLDAASVVRIELAGTGAGQFDVLDVGGSATLDGTLDVVALDPFVTSFGDSFELLTFTNSNGSFARVDVPFGNTLDVTANPGNLGVEVTSTTDFIRWTGAGDGASWNDAANWERPDTLATGVPTQQDDVDISTPGAAVQLTGAQAVEELRVSGRELFLSSGSLTVGESAITDSRLTIGNATLILPAGAALESADVVVGEGSGTTGTVSMDAASWLARGRVVLGEQGAGCLTLDNGSEFLGRPTFPAGGGGLVVGAQQFASGNLTISSGSRVDTESDAFDNLVIARDAGSSGSVTLTGTGSSIVTRGTDNTVQVGLNGTGTLLVDDGGTVSTLHFEAGRFGNGTATVRGYGSSVVASNDNGLFSGQYVNEAGFVRAGRNNGADGTINVLDGALLEARDTTLEDGARVSVAHDGGSTGTLLVDGGVVSIRSGASDFDGPARLTASRQGNGSVTLRNGGYVRVQGPGAEAVVSSAGIGNGMLAVEAGSRLHVFGTGARVDVGGSAGGNGALSVSGSGALVDVQGGRLLGDGGGISVRGNLDIGAGGTVDVESGDFNHVEVGSTDGGAASLTVSGAGASLVTRGTDNAVKIGYQGQGTLLVDSGGLVDVLHFGVGRDSVGTATVSGAGSVIRASAGNGRFSAPYQREAGWVQVGREFGGVGTLNVLAGGRLESLDVAGHGTTGPEIQIARNKGSVGTVNVDGAGSLVLLQQEGGSSSDPNLFSGPGFTLGRRGEARLNISNGGEVRVVGDEAVFRVATGTASSDPDQGPLTVTSSVDVSTGGLLSVQGPWSRMQVATNTADTSGTMTVDGAGSRVEVVNNLLPGAPSPDGYYDLSLRVGTSGEGTLLIQDGATVAIGDGDNSFVWSGIGGFGTDSSGLLTTRTGGGFSLSSSYVSEINLRGPSSIDPTGTLLISAGTTVTADSVFVHSGGNMTGDGQVNANVSMFSGGTLSPGEDVGNLGISGNLQVSGGRWLVEARSPVPGDFDTVTVSGSLGITFGDIELMSIDGYSPNFGDSFEIATFSTNSGSTPTLLGPFGTQLNQTLALTTLTLNITAADVFFDWTGDGFNQFWGNPGNWLFQGVATSQVPGFDDDARITTLDVVRVESFQQVDRLQQTNASGGIVIDQGGELSVWGESRIDGSTVIDDGNLTVNGGGNLTTSGLEVASGPGSTGHLEVFGRLEDTGLLRIGGDGEGSATVHGGGVLLSGSSGQRVELGRFAGASGNVSINGGTWTSTSEVVVGDEGIGNLTLSGNARFTAPQLTIAANPVAGPTFSGDVTVNEFSQIDLTGANTDRLTVGRSGAGRLRVLGGTLDAGNLDNCGSFCNTWIGRGAGATGEFLIADGASSNAIVNLDALFIGSPEVFTGFAGTPGGVTNAALNLQGGDLRTARVVLGVATSGSDASGTESATASATVTGGEWLATSMSLGDAAVSTGDLTVSGGRVALSDGLFIAQAPGSTSSVTVTGPTSVLDVTGAEITVGQQGDGSLLVEAGGRVNTLGFNTIANAGSASGVVTVTGTGSTLTGDGGALNVANGSVFTQVEDGFDFGTPGNTTATLNVLAGGQVTGFNRIVAGNGFNIDGGRTEGTVLVDGAGSLLETSGTDNQVRVGDGGGDAQALGNLTVSGGARLNTLDLEVGRSGEPNIATITGAGTQVVLSNDTGRFSGEFANEAGFVRVARDDGERGTLQVLDGALLEIRGTTTEAGPGLQLARELGSTATLLVDNATIDATQTVPLDPALSFGAFLQAGRGGNADVTIRNGATVNIEGPEAYINAGQLANASGSISITGPGSTLRLTGLDSGMNIGRDGSGTVHVEQGGSLEATFLSIGRNAGSSGNLTIDGSLDAPGERSQAVFSAVDSGGFGAFLNVGRAGTGVLEVLGGGLLQVDRGGTGRGHGINIGGDFSDIGGAGARSGTVLVSGAGSHIEYIGESGLLQVGRDGTGNLTVEDGGNVSGATYMGVGVTAAAQGTVAVTGSGSSLSLSGQFDATAVDLEPRFAVGDKAFMIVGVAGNGNLLVGNEATVAIGDAGPLIAGRGSALVLGGPGDFFQPATVSGVGGGGIGTGSVVVEGNASLSVRGESATVVVGNTGDGTLDVTGGGDVTIDAPEGALVVGNVAGATGDLMVTGAGSALLMSGTTGNAVVGSAGHGSANVSAGGTLQTLFLDLGSQDGGNGTLTVDAADWTDIGRVTVGRDGSGELLLDNATTATLGFLGVGDGNGTGTATVTGAGTTLGVEVGMHVGGIRDGGTGGDGTLVVSDGAAVNVTGNSGFAGTVDPVVSVAHGAGSTGNLTVEGNASLTAPDVIVGDASGTGGPVADGLLQVLTGGSVDAGNLTVAFAPAAPVAAGNATGQVSVEGTGSQLFVQQLRAAEGPATSATIDILDQAHLDVAGNTSLGTSGDGAASLVVDNASVDATAVTVGDASTGTLIVRSAGSLSADTVTLGATATGNGTLNVQSADLDASIELVVGDLGSGELLVSNPDTTTSQVETPLLEVARTAGSTGNVSITGNASLLSGTANEVIVGNAGTGNLSITGGSRVEALLMEIGLAAGGNGTVQVAGAGTKLDVNGAGSIISVGDAGTGALNITGGAVVDPTALLVGVAATGFGNVTVDGNGDPPGERSTLAVSGDLPSFGAGAAANIGIAGFGHVEVLGGGLFSVSGASLPVPSVSLGGTDTISGGNGALIVHGAGSALQMSGDTPLIAVGHDGIGTLEVRDGGAVSGATLMLLGDSADADGTLLVEGPGSSVVLAGIVSTAALSVLPSATSGDGPGLIVGMTGTGNVTVSEGASLLLDPIGSVLPPNRGAAVSLGGAHGVPGGGGVGALTVTGTGSELRLAGNEAQLASGYDGFGCLTIDSGGLVVLENPDGEARTFAGLTPGGNGRIIIAGAGSLLDAGAELLLGLDGTTPTGSGRLELGGGATARAGTLRNVGTITTFGSGGATLEATLDQLAGGTLEVPGASLTLDGAGTATHLADGDVSVAAGRILTIADSVSYTSAGELSLAGTFVMAAGIFEHQAGNISGSGVLDLSPATLTVDSANPLGLDVNINVGDLEVSDTGVFDVRRFVTVFGTTTVDAGGVIDVAASGFLELLGDATVEGDILVGGDLLLAGDVSGFGLITNEGLITTAGIAGVQTVSAELDVNNGAFDLSAGDLALQGFSFFNGTLTVDGGELLLQGMHDFAEGASLAGSGSARVENAGFANLLGGLTVDGLLEIAAGGELDGGDNGSLDGGLGTVHVTGGTITGSLSNFGTLEFVGGDVDGVLSNESGAFLVLGEGASIGGAGRIENAGEVTLPGGTSVAVNVQFDNLDGSFGGAGILDLFSSGSHSGNFTVDSVTVRIITGLHDFRGVVVNGAGTLEASGGRLFVDGPGLVVDGSLSVGVDSILDGVAGGSLGGTGQTRLAGGTIAGELSNTGFLRLHSGNITGNLSNEAAGTLRFGTGIVANGGGGAISNAGLAEKTEGGDFAWSVDFVNLAGGVVDVSTGSLSLDSIRNEGTIRVTGAGRLTDAAGGPALLNAATGRIEGTGTIGNGATQLVNEGLIVPGEPGAGGTLTVDGDLLLQAGGTVRAELAGAPPGSFGQIAVTGDATLGGTLEVALVAPFTPSPGDSFAVLTCGVACTGDFATLDDPAGVGFSPTATSAAFTLDILALLKEWTGSGGDFFWTNPQNWSDGALPGAGDSVFIAAPGTLTVVVDNGVQTIAALETEEVLQITGGTLRITSTSDVAGTISVNGGNLELGGAGEPYSIANLDLTAGGTLDTAGNLTITNALNWDDASIIGSGSVNLPAFTTVGLNSGGTVTLDARLDNAATVTLPNGFFMQGNGSIDNAGTLRTVDGAANIGVAVSNTSNVQAGNSSTITLSGGGDHAGGFIALPGSFVNLSGLHRFDGASGFTGGGRINATGAGTELRMDGTGVGAAVVSAGTVLDFNEGTVLGGAGELRNQGELIIEGATLATSVDTDGGITRLLQGLSSASVQAGAGLSGTGQVVFASGNTTLPAGVGYDMSAGATEVAGGNVTFAGPAQTGSLDVGGGTVRFAGSTTSTDVTLDVAGSATFDGPASLDSYTQTDGTLDGNGDVTVSGTTRIERGGVEGSGTLFANGGLDLDLLTSTNLDIGRTIVAGGAGTWTLASEATITGGGLVRNAGNLSLQNTNPVTVAVALENTAAGRLGIDGALVDFSASLANQGDINVAPGSELRKSDSPLLFEAGRIGGGGTLNAGLNMSGSGARSLAIDANLSVLDLAGGSLDIESGNVSVSGTATVRGPATLTVDAAASLDAGTLDVLGTLRSSGTLSSAGETTVFGGSGTGLLDVIDGSFASGGDINVASTLSWGDATLSAPTVDVGPGGTLIAAGSLAKTLASPLQVRTGTLRVSGADLSLTGNSTFGTPGSPSANIDVASGRTLVFDGGIHTFTGTARFDGAGTAELAGGTTWNGPADIAVNTALRWANGTMSAGGTTTVNGSLNIAGAALVDRVLRNAGPSVWAATGSLNGSGSFQNLAGGTLVVQADATFPLPFSNSGSLIKTGGAGTTTFSGSFDNAGTVNAAAGTIAFGGGYAQSGGQAVVSGGTLAFPGGLALNAGTLGGSGTITGDITNTGGTVAPGNSPGALTIAGDYVQGPSARLLLELGGTTPGSGHDQLLVTGNATLDGTLDVRLIGGFIGEVGDTFEVLGYSALDGDFATLVSPETHTFSRNPGALAYRLETSAIVLETLPTDPVDPTPTGVGGDPVVKAIIAKASDALTATLGTQTTNTERATATDAAPGTDPDADKKDEDDADEAQETTADADAEDGEHDRSPELGQC